MARLRSRLVGWIAVAVWLASGAILFACAAPRDATYSLRLDPDSGSGEPIVQLCNEETGACVSSQREEAALPEGEEPDVLLARAIDLSGLESNASTRPEACLGNVPSIVAGTRIATAVAAKVAEAEHFAVSARVAEEIDRLAGVLCPEIERARADGFDSWGALAASSACMRLTQATETGDAEVLRGATDTLHALAPYVIGAANREASVLCESGRSF